MHFDQGLLLQTSISQEEKKIKHISGTIFTTCPSGLPYTLFRNNSSLPNFPFPVQLFPFPAFPSSLAGALKGKVLNRYDSAQGLQDLTLNSEGSANLKQKWSNLCRMTEVTKQERQRNRNSV